VVAVVAGVVVHPLVGLGMFAVALGALRVPFGRGVGVAAAVAVGGAGVFTVVRQVHSNFPADFGWTDHFTPAHYLAWIGLALVALLLIVDWVRRRE
jgi:hypothetical protein